MDNRSLALRLIRLQNGTLVPLTCQQLGAQPNHALTSFRIAAIGDTGDRP